MKHIKLQILLMLTLGIILSDINFIQAQNETVNGNLTVTGGNIYLSNRGNGGARVYGGGTTWSGMLDQAGKWAFLSKKNVYSSVRINSAQINLYTSGQVDFKGTPVKLTYAAFNSGPDFTSDEDAQDKSLNQIKANTPYTALYPQYPNRTWIGIPGKQLHSVYTTNIYRTYERSLSDKRVKNDIKPLNGSLDKILALNGYSYKHNENHPFYAETDKQRDRTNLGFMAQDLQKVIPEMVVEDKQIGYLMVQNYEQLFPVIVEAMKEQQALIEEKDQLVADLVERLEKLEEVAESTQQILEDSSVEVSLSGSQGALLSQNYPNPFNGFTSINFFVPHASDSAKIQIFDQNGRLWKSINIADRGHGNLKVQTSDIPAGTFAYSLEVNGKIIATKKMVISE